MRAVPGLRRAMAFFARGQRGASSPMSGAGASAMERISGRQVARKLPQASGVDWAVPSGR